VIALISLTQCFCAICRDLCTLTGSSDEGAKGSEQSEQSGQLNTKQTVLPKSKATTRLGLAFGPQEGIRARLRVCKECYSDHSETFNNSDLEQFSIVMSHFTF